MRKKSNRGAALTIRVRPCTIDKGQYRWDIWGGDKILMSSIASFTNEKSARAAGRLNLPALIGEARKEMRARPNDTED